MLFQEEHIDAIRANEKTVTRRDWDDGHAGPTVGSIQPATTDLFVPDEECDCYVRILNRYEERLGEMTAEDADAEGGYALAEFRELWRDLNGAWEPDLVVDVIEFEYVGRERPEAPVEAEGVSP